MRRRITELSSLRSVSCSSSVLPYFTENSIFFRSACCLASWWDLLWKAGTDYHDHAMGGRNHGITPSCTFGGSGRSWFLCSANSWPQPLRYDPAAVSLPWFLESCNTTCSHCPSGPRVITASCCCDFLSGLILSSSNHFLVSINLTRFDFSTLILIAIWEIPTMIPSVKLLISTWFFCFVK